MKRKYADYVEETGDRMRKIRITEKIAKSSDSAYLNEIYTKTHQLLVLGANPQKKTLGKLMKLECKIDNPNGSSTNGAIKLNYSAIPIVYNERLDFFDNGSSFVQDSTDILNRPNINRKPKVCDELDDFSDDRTSSIPDRTDILNPPSRQDIKKYRQLRLDCLWLNRPVDCETTEEMEIEGSE